MFWFFHCCEILNRCSTWNIMCISFDGRDDLDSFHCSESWLMVLRGILCISFDCWDNLILFIDLNPDGFTWNIMHVSSTWNTILLSVLVVVLILSPLITLNLEEQDGFTWNIVRISFGCWEWWFWFFSVPWILNRW